jgi:hypothetical protein
MSHVEVDEPTEEGRRSVRQSLQNAIAAQGVVDG